MANDPGYDLGQGASFYVDATEAPDESGYEGEEGGYEADFSMIYYDLPGKWNPAVEEIIIRNIHALARKAGRK